MHFSLKAFFVVSAVLLPALSASLYPDLPYVLEGDEAPSDARIEGLLNSSSTNKSAAAAACAKGNHSCGYNRCCPNSQYCVTDGYSIGCCPNGKKCYKPATGCTFKGDHKCSGKKWCCPPGVACSSTGCKF